MKDERLGWAPKRFHHRALIVDAEDTIDRVLVPTLRRHADQAEPVLMVVGPVTEEVVRARLPDAADAFDWADPGTFYQRLGFAHASFLRYTRDQCARERAVHVVAEPDIDSDPRAPVDRPWEYLRYEAMCNEALPAYGCPVTCIWDGRRHPKRVIDGVRRVHDEEVTPHGVRVNPRPVTAMEYLARTAQAALPPPPATVDFDLYVRELHQLAGARAVARGWALRHGFLELAALQVVTALSEVLTNGVVHGEPPVRARGWRHGDTLVLQVDDRGARAVPPDAGFRRPRGTDDALGLWAARQAADVLLTRTDATGTSVRMFFPFAQTHHGLTTGVDNG